MSILIACIFFVFGIFCSIELWFYWIIELNRMQVKNDKLHAVCVAAELAEGFLTIAVYRWRDRMGNIR